MDKKKKGAKKLPKKTSKDSFSYIKTKSDVEKNNSKNTAIKSKKLGICLIVFLGILILLILKIAYLQFIKGSELKESAHRQQIANIVISPKRGNIYDSTGKLLAASASVDTVSINPTRIKDKDKERVAKILSEVFELDYDETLKKVKSENSVETIIKKVEKDKIDKLKEWMKENKYYSGINIDEDAKRYYPYGTLASNLIGFCNTDNEGQEGLELKWNSVLSGTAGKITSIESAGSQLIPNKNETYVPAENGNNITLTIDANIQTTVEKYLKQACLENDCRSGGSAIVMNPNNGDILAMATYPNYDLNSPRTPNDELSSTWDSLSSTDQLNSLYKMWRNKSVSDTYEPGSTFKIITAAVGLEEGIVDTDTPGSFNCTGSELINGISIKCWKSPGSHGSQTLRNALMNSCNPALMQLGKKIGAPTLYKYYKAFGLFDKTQIATTGEVNSYFWDLDDVGNVELATMSFGQRFRITPIQLITAISAIANDGVLVEPRIVKQIENPDTHSVTTIQSTNVRQVISKETSLKLLDMLESVVSEGTGKYGQVKGYSVAGKTGTSEPDTTNKDSMYVASFIGISPTENPEVVALVTLYDPKGSSGHQGGTIAAPVVSQILTEVLPYLGVPSDDLSSGSENTTIPTTNLPDVRNKTVTEAKKILESAGFNCKFSGTDASQVVTDQVPKPGTALINGASVNIYTAENEARVSRQVPNLKGMSYTEAKNTLKSNNLNIHVTGTGTVLSQDPMAGTTVEEGTVINVTLKQYIKDAH